MAQASETAATTDGQGIDGWFTPGRFAAVLGVLICACFPQVVSGLEVFAFGDSSQFAYPMAFYWREAFWRGEIPLWNPLSSCGIPFLAQWNTMVLYPPTLFYLLLPFSWGYGLFCLGHLFWAGLGMYCLAHRWTSHRLAAAVAGGAFAFSGLTWYGLMWPHLLAALAWMPWVILTAERAWLEGGRMLVFAALAGAMQMLSGGAEAILQTWIIIPALGAAEYARSCKASAGPKPRTLVWRFGLVGLWVGALAAAQLLPFLDLLWHSQRSAYYGHSQITSLASLPWAGVANLFVPLFHCVRASAGVYAQAGQSWLGSCYLGIGIVALAAVALWRVRQSKVWLLAGLALLGWWMALGHAAGLYGVAKAVVPVIGMVRFPVKFIMLVAFALPLLAAYGLSWVLQLPAARWSAEKKLLRGLVLGVIAITALIVCAAWVFPIDQKEGLRVSGNAVPRLLFLLLGAGGVALLKSGRLELKTNRFLQLALVAVLWLDIFTHAPNLSPTVPRSLLEPNLARDCFKWDQELTAGAARAMESRETFWKVLPSGSSDLELDVKMRRLTLFMNYSLLDEVPKIDGFYSSDIREYYDVFGSVYFKTNRANGLKDFLGIAYECQIADGPEWRRRPSALPMITAGQQPEFCSEPDALAALTADAFAPLRSVYLPLEARGQVAAAGPVKARVVSSRFAAQHVEAEVEAEAPTLMVVAQAYYPRWQACVDGRPARLWRANHAFQAVEIPAGKHQISLVYRDNAFRRGVAISLFSLLGCALGLRRPRPGRAQ